MSRLEIEEEKSKYLLENPRCYYCNEEIWFHPKYVHDTGTPIPLDIERDFSGQIVEHLCTPRKLKLLQRSFTKCYRCGCKITFDKSIRSRKGILIPCEYNEKTHELERHICGNSQGYKHSMTQRNKRKIGTIPKASEDVLMKQEIDDWKFKECWK